MDGELYQALRNFSKGILLSSDPFYNIMVERLCAVRVGVLIFFGRVTWLFLLENNDLVKLYFDTFDQWRNLLETSIHLVVNSFSSEYALQQKLLL